MYSVITSTDIAVLAKSIDSLGMAIFIAGCMLFFGLTTLKRNSK